MQYATDDLIADSPPLAPRRAGSPSVIQPLAEVMRWLVNENYEFITPSPATHGRVNGRAGNERARSLTGVFGWSRPFTADLLPPRILECLDTAGALHRFRDLYVSDVRFSTLHGRLYVHSAFPTLAADSVFFGPDTYRFANFIRATLASISMPETPLVVDVGCGSGAGGMVAAQALGRACNLVMSDINPRALRLAAVNCAAHRVAASLRQCDLFAGLDGAFDLIVANPPYLADPQARLYRDGGGNLGSQLSLRIVSEGLARMAAGGTLILYTGSPIVDGRDLMRASLHRYLTPLGIDWTYQELDPDVFGEELEVSAYANVDRIAVVGAVIKANRGERRAPRSHTLRSAL